jgi:HD-GYP domain-containing protein (c-di-GMP phosphodiesterase class II)
MSRRARSLPGSPVEISVNDPEADPAERALLEQLGFTRLMICRLDVGGEAFGTVEIYRVLDRPFRQGDDRQVATLSEFAANALQRIQLTETIETHYTATLTALASALEAKDPYTQEHTSRIRALAIGIAETMGVSAVTRRAVGLGAILHDVGKIGIADSILLKPGPLTDEEWAAMRRHPLIGEHMLKDIDFVRTALPILRHHHERWDGAGYPDGLKGDEIPLGARIVAVCDSFDAMTTDRPYRKRMSVEAACEELVANAGTQFDPNCATLAVQVISELGADNLDDRFVRYSNV